MTYFRQQAFQTAVHCPWQIMQVLSFRPFHYPCYFIRRTVQKNRGSLLQLFYIIYTIISYPYAHYKGIMKKVYHGDVTDFY